jgi:hypothetical protein
VSPPLVTVVKAVAIFFDSVLNLPFEPKREVPWSEMIATKNQ